MKLFRFDVQFFRFGPCSHWRPTRAIIPFVAKEADGKRKGQAIDFSVA